jgi:hypothetical protein
MVQKRPFRLIIILKEYFFNMGFTFTVYSTGASYLVLFLALAFLTYRFFQYWQRTRDITSKCFFYFSISFAMFALIRAVSGLFFINNMKILTISSVPVAFFEGLSAAIVAYILFYLKLPKISPWVGFSIMFLLTLVATVSTAILSPYLITIGEGGVITWVAKEGNNLYSAFRAGMLVFAFASLIIIFFQQFINSTNPFLRRRLLGLIIVLFLAVIIGIASFIAEDILRLYGITGGKDILVGALSIILFAVIYFTQKPNQIKTQ